MHFLDYLDAGDLDVNAIDGVAKSQTRLSDWTELNWTEVQIKFVVVVQSLSYVLFSVTP